MSMPLSSWMIENAALQPGMTVVELAAGPGDTGFLAAELVAPGGTLISSDGADAMVEVARARAERLGITNAEFRRLELEWIDLETASVDVVLCRWGVMLTVDPAAALQEMRRVLKPIGKAVIAVWDTAEVNPWATIPTGVLIERGLAPPPDPDAPGMFVLAAPGRLQEMLEDAGFADVRGRVGRPATGVRRRRGVRGRARDAVRLVPPRPRGGGRERARGGHRSHRRARRAVPRGRRRRIHPAGTVARGRRDRVDVRPR